MTNPEKTANKKPMSRKAVAAIAAASLVAGAVVLDKLGVVDLGLRSKTDVEQPEVTIRKIKPIDIGCFVQVDASTELKAHEHKVAGIGIMGFDIGDKTLWTNSTTAENDGIGRLCVDNKGTKITLVTDNANHTKTLNVNIGALYTEGYIVHNGHDGAYTNRAFGQRVGEVFGGDGNQNIKAGLDKIAQTLFQQTPCVEDAVPVAKKSIEQHYTNLANTISGGTVTDVNITYDALPREGNFPTGDNVNKALGKLGLDIPKNWGIASKAPLCSVVEIGGQPAVAVG